jgi:hypothetical protein
MPLPKTAMIVDPLRWQSMCWSATSSSVAGTCNGMEGVTRGIAILIICGVSL